MPEGLGKLMHHTVLFFIVLASCFIFAELSERRLKWLRYKLSKSK